MYYILAATSLTLFLLPLKVGSYNNKARLAEWEIDNFTNDEVADIIKTISQNPHIKTLNHSSEIHDRIKRLVSFDSADQRTGNIERKYKVLFYDNNLKYFQTLIITGNTRLKQLLL